MHSHTAREEGGRDKGHPRSVMQHLLLLGALDGLDEEHDTNKVSLGASS